MTYIPRTPFRRASHAAVVKQATALPGRPQPQLRDKWKILRALATARKSYGLSDRDITVLQALISFHHSAELDMTKDLVVHPSNNSICERLNGMPNSTMRRHVAKLVDAGIITRRDSPNGKRYVRRLAGARIAYGFDLSPFAQRAAEFHQAAEAELEAQQATKLLRETIMLIRRDLMALVEDGRSQQPELPLWDQLSDMIALKSRALRRKLVHVDLQEIEEDFCKALAQVEDNFLPLESEEMSSNDAETEQHIQNSKSDISMNKDQPRNSHIDLDAIISDCSELQNYTEKRIDDWRTFQELSQKIRPMTGITDHSWKDAVLSMGLETASAVAAIILERLGQIRSPDGYMRRLSAEARAGRLCLKRMLRTIQVRLPDPACSQL